MNVKLNGHKKRDPAASLDDGSQVASLMQAFHQAIVEDAFLDASDLVDVTFSLANEHVQTVLGQLATNVRAVAETTRDEIRALVGKQAELGWSVEELQKQIRAKGEIASRSRALLIARTETAAAYSQGSLAAYTASGVVKQVEWLIGPDSCDLCVALDGNRVDLGDEFEPGVTGPPLHPNCTCAISPIVE